MGFLTGTGKAVFFGAVVLKIFVVSEEAFLTESVWEILSRLVAVSEIEFLAELVVCGFFAFRIIASFFSKVSKSIVPFSECLVVTDVSEVLRFALLRPVSV